MRETLGVHEFARLSGKHFNTVYNWIRSGGVSARKQDGEWRIPTSELDRIRSRGGDGKARSDLGKQTLSRHGSSRTHVMAESRSDELQDMVTELREIASAIETAERLRPRLLELRRQA